MRAVRRAPARVTAVVVAMAAATYGIAEFPMSAGAQEVAAAKPRPLKFLGIEIKSLPMTYLVLKDVNVRARPETKSKRVGRLKRRSRVASPGRVRGPWIAVRKDGKDFGFVYEPVLMPVLDGTLEKNLVGVLKPLPGRPNTPSCDYVIHFEGKSPAQGQLFEFADYEVTWNCTARGRRARFSTQMFMSEGAYRGDSRPLRQITIDIQDLGDENEDVFSTDTIYDFRAGEVRFDGSDVPSLGKKPKNAKLAAASVAEALGSAVTLAYRSWTDRAWRELMRPGR